MPYEHCDVCHEPTGRAGAGEDSIYREVLRRSDELFCNGSPVCGEDMYAGPLCEDCYDVLKRFGFFPDE